MNPKFFRTPSDFRNWLERNHAEKRELSVGFYKKASGKASITWPESVDEALCFGWIDGIRKRIDELSYQIRFTPRRRGSIWSTINIKRARELRKQKRMQPAGSKAFAARIESKSRIYSYEHDVPNWKSRISAGSTRTNRPGISFRRNRRRIEK